MAGIHEYEDSLDALDRKFYAGQGCIVVELEPKLKVPLAECRTSYSAMLEQGKRLFVWMAVHGHYGGSYLVKRYVQLVAKGTSFSFDPENTASLLMSQAITSSEYKLEFDNAGLASSIRFSDASGQTLYPRHIALSRILSPDGKLLFQIERYASFGRQLAKLESFEIVFEDRHIFFFVPAETEWTDLDGPGSPFDRPYRRAMCSTIVHGFGADDRSKIDCALRSICDGMDVSISKAPRDS